MTNIAKRRGPARHTARRMMALGVLCIVAGASCNSEVERLPVAQPEPALVDHIPAGRWRAANEQARTITGNLHVTPPEQGTEIVSLAFAQGITLRARPATLPNDDADVRKRLEQARVLLGAGAEDFPRHFTVIQETVATSAPLAGLCGGLRTRTLAVVEMKDAQGWRLLRVASFHGPSPSDTTAGELPACFTFDFVQDR